MNRNSHAVDGNFNWCAVIVQNCFQYLLKLNIRAPYDSTAHFLSAFPTITC